MNNYTNSRIQGFNNNKIIGMIEHTLRIVKSRNDKNNKTNYLYFKDEKGVDQMIRVSYLSKKDQQELSVEELEQYKNDRKILLDYYKTLLAGYESDREEHNELHKQRRRGENLTDSTGSWAEGVLTFSEKIRDDFENGKLDEALFMERGITAARESCDYLGAELINVTLHLSEKTPHFHYTFKNFDENGKSLTHSANLIAKGKSKSQLQDIMIKHFKDDFECVRGIEKAISGKTKHNDTIDWYEQEISTKNKELKSKDIAINSKQLKFDELEAQTKESEEILNSLNAKLDDTKELRARIKSIEGSSDKKKKEFYSKISDIQSEIRSYIKTIRSNSSERKEFINNIFKIQSDEDLSPKDKTTKIATLTFDFFENKFNEINLLEIQELNNSFEAVANDVASLKMVIVGLNEEIAKKDTKIGNMDYKIQQVDSMIEIARSEANKTLKDENLSLDNKLNEKEKELKAKDNELNQFKVSNKALNNKLDKSIDKRVKTISKAINERNEKKRIQKQFDRFLESKNLSKEFSNFRSKELMDMCIPVEKSSDSNLLNKIKIKRLANGKTKKIEVEDIDID